MSYETKIPRFLHNTDSHEIHDSVTSLLSHIKSYEAWSHPKNGFKVKWKEYMTRFRTLHNSSIRNAFPSKNLMYQACLLTCTTVIIFSNMLISFIDDTYGGYIDEKFSLEKSWHITTQLLPALILEMIKPRESTIDDFIPGDHLSNVKVISFVRYHVRNTICQFY